MNIQPGTIPPTPEIGRDQAEAWAASSSLS